MNPIKLSINEYNLIKMVYSIHMQSLMLYTNIQTIFFYIYIATVWVPNYLVLQMMLLHSLAVIMMRYLYSLNQHITDFDALFAKTS